MSTASHRAPSRNIDMPVRPAARSLLKPVWWAPRGGVRRLMPPRWLNELVALALTGLLVGAAALGGLAAVSHRVPMSASSVADCWLPGDDHGETGALGALDVRLLCLEMR